MSTWSSSERFWMDVMNISIALPVLAIAAAVGWSVLKTVLKRDKAASGWPPEGWPPEGPGSSPRGRLRKLSS